MSLIEKLYKGGALSDHDIKIIVTYGWARRGWIDAMFRLSVANRIPMSELPQVITASSMPGRQASFIIFDPSLTQVDSLGDLGLAQDANLMNVVHTRGRRGQMTLFKREITTGAIAENWKTRKDKTGRGIYEVSFSSESRTSIARANIRHRIIHCHT